MQFNLYCFDVNKIKSLREKYKKSKDFSFLLKKSHGYKEEDANNLRSFPGFEYKIFHNSPKATEPGWLGFVNQGLKDKKIELLKKSVSLLILLKLNKAGVYFAITFGSSHHILNKDIIIDDFGLKTVLNSIDPKKVTLIDGKKIGPNTKETRTVFSKSTDYYNFGLDELEELLTKLEGLPEDFNLGVKLSGNDSLSFNLVLSNNFLFSKLGEQVEKYYHNYGLKNYEKNFKFIDNYKLEIDSKVINKLNEKLVKYLLLSKNDYQNISISLPNLLDHVDIYNITIDGIGEKLDLLKEEEILPVIRLTLKSYKGEKIKKLKDIRVYGVEFQNEEKAEKFSFYRCINFETENSGNKYILHNGTWNKVDSDFLQKVNAAIDKLNFITPSKYKEFGINFIAFDGKKHTKQIQDGQGNTKMIQDEGVYNEELSAHISGLCLDKQLFTKLPGVSKVEICDILLHEKFLHLKRGSGSEKLSHLYNQGVVSLELFRKHDEYINDIQKRINEYNKKNSKNKKNWNMSQINKIKVVLGIIINGDIKSKIPFFSKITLLKASTAVRAMSGELIIVQINDDTKK